MLYQNVQPNHDWLVFNAVVLFLDSGTNYVDKENPAFHSSSVPPLNSSSDKPTKSPAKISSSNFLSERIFRKQNTNGKERKKGEIPLSFELLRETLLLFFRFQQPLLSRIEMLLRRQTHCTSSFKCRFAVKTIASPSSIK